MYGAVALPKNDPACLECRPGLAALQRTKLNCPGIPDHHLLQGNAHGKAGVAAQVLVGQEQDPFGSGEPPFEGGAGVG
jgi:hypothetical protein